MLSTFPSLSSESCLGNPFPVFEGGFSPWDYNEPLFLFQTPSLQVEEPVVFSPQPSQEPVSPNSGSYTSNPAPITPNSGSCESNQNDSCKNLITSGSDETIRLGSVIDERKRRRMMSNRESARRSRMRKQKHLENMRNQVSRLRMGNREVMNRLRLVMHQNQLIRGENHCLRSESMMLRQRLWDIRQVLLVRQLQHHLNPSAWPCNNPTFINEGQLPHHSLIT